VIHHGSAKVCCDVSACCWKLNCRVIVENVKLNQFLEIDIKLNQLLDKIKSIFRN